MHLLFKRIRNLIYTYILAYSAVYVAFILLVFVNTECIANTPATNQIKHDSITIDLNNKANRLMILAKDTIYSEPNLAKELAKQSFDFYEKKNNFHGMAAACNIIGSGYFLTGEYLTAIQYYKSAYDYNLKINNKKDLAKNLNNIGNSYLKLGELEKALEQYFHAQKIYQELNLPQGILSINNNIGLIYKNTGNLNKALISYNKALSASKKINNLQQQATILYNIAAIYIEQKEFLKAQTICQKSYEIRKELNNKSGQVKNLTALGRIHYYKNNLSVSSDYFSEALQLAREVKNVDEEALILQHLGYNSLDTENLLEARGYFTQSLELTEKLKIDRLTIDNYKYLAQVDSLLGDFKSAMAFQQKYYKLQPKSNNFSVANRLAELQKKYELTRKENIATNFKLRKSRSLISYLVVILIVLVLCSLIVVQQIKLKNEKRISVLTQRNLRSQMNPHFIFNVLNSIQYYILRNDKEASGKYLAKFASLLRITLENSENNLVSINDELQSLKLYLELEAMRLENELEYHIEIDQNIDSYMFKIPTLLLQPFVENSIIHGIQKKNGKGKLHIELKLKDNGIHCLIEDNGVGRKKAYELKSNNEKKRKSFGSNITETRLQLLNSLYGKNLGIVYSDLTDDKEMPCGTRVEFDLPIMN